MRDFSIECFQESLSSPLLKDACCSSETSPFLSFHCRGSSPPIVIFYASGAVRFSLNVGKCGRGDTGFILTFPSAGSNFLSPFPFPPRVVSARHPVNLRTGISFQTIFTTSPRLFPFGARSPFRLQQIPLCAFQNVFLLVLVFENTRRSRCLRLARFFFAGFFLEPPSFSFPKTSPFPKAASFCNLDPSPRKPLIFPSLG